ncbi:MAG TPA: PQQ-binding-like beta-propeller repeat protein [Streptosporangiaceae bacterium]|nr:PQQ-binding-like beta-propeller repeat protein [Streptosporangiaceae bacterium]
MHSPTARAYLAAGVFTVLTALVAGCSSGPTGSTVSNPGVARPAGSWPYPNGDLANTRAAAGSVISSANVSRLRQAWTFKLTGSAVASAPGFGSLAATPIVTNGVVYMQDLDANVYALGLASGKLKWEYKVNSPEKSGPGPDGVAVANGTVYGDTSTAVFALNASTGKAVWTDTHLLGSGQGAFEIQPQVAGGRVYLASAYGLGRGGGVLFALNAATGRLLWKFNTLLGTDRGVRTTGIGSGGAWETPLVGSDESVTFGIGNPYQSAASAIAHPSAQLYTDSDVNLDASTGKLRWYYQGLADDFMDHDMQASPIAATVSGVPAIIGSGKLGVVFAMNAHTGKLIWKTPVGEHSRSDSYPAEALDHTLSLTAPYTILPGSLGGVLTNMSLAGHSVYVATVDLPFTLAKMSYPLGTPDGDGTGEIEALDVTTGHVEWDTKVPAMPLGATTVSNDLVFTTLYNGVLIALNRATGTIVYRHSLPTSANAPIAIAGNAILVPAGGSSILGPKGGSPQLVTYTVP